MALNISAVGNLSKKVSTKDSKWFPKLDDTSVKLDEVDRVLRFTYELPKDANPNTFTWRFNPEDRFAKLILFKSPTPLNWTSATREYEQVVHIPSRIQTIYTLVDIKRKMEHYRE